MGALVGHITSEDIKRKISLAHTGMKKPWVKPFKPTGEINGNWKGDNVSYRNLHRWVERWAGKANKCMNNPNHKSTRYHWANISKEYKRDLEDFQMLCPSCNCKDRVGRRITP